MPTLAFRHDSVRRLRRLVDRRADRWQERRFVIEGAKVLAEALDAGTHIESVYVEPARADAHELAVAERGREAGAEVFEVQLGVLARACDTVHGPPLAAVAEMVHVPLADLQGRADPLIVVCAGLQDPGNAGAVLRSAGAAGASAVVFCTGSVDAYNPKAVRSSAGALFHVPVVAGGTEVEVLDELGRWGLQRIAAVSTGGTDYTEVDLTAGTALVLGHEAHGLPSGIEAAADRLISVPMATWTESLNVAMAATVLCFEAARQRKGRAV